MLLLLLQKSFASNAPLGHRGVSRPAAKRPKTEQLSQSEQMHPSWQAKQKQKQAMLTAAPTGSKTVFAEDGLAVSTAAPAKAVKTGTGNAVNSSKQQLVSEKLHPSWDAKRNAALWQNELASRTHASKIVFED